MSAVRPAGCHFADPLSASPSLQLSHAPSRHPVGPKSIAAVTEARNGDAELLLAAQRQTAQEEPTEADIHAIGTIGTILQHVPLPDGTVKVIVEGKRRARIRSFVQPAPFFCCEVDPIEENDARGVETEALARSIRSTFEKYVKLNRKIPPELLNSLAQIQSASRLADTVAAHLSLKLEDRSTLGGTSKITLNFDLAANTLRQWVVIDPQGYETSVSLYNLDTQRRPDQKNFVIDYQRVL